MIRSVLTQETVYELQPVKDCHDKIKLERKPRVVWCGKNIVVAPSAEQLLNYKSHQPSRLPPV